MALTPKQERFCEEYAVDFNGTQAAIRAGYSRRTANEQASRLLANVSVSEYIAARRAIISERAIVTPADVLRGLKREAEYEGEGASHSARVSAWKAIGEFIDMSSGSTAKGPTMPPGTTFEADADE